ncbi:VanW family protein [Candidatus Gottesmanbacteria bacterium]|nr:VanW family protein [Candidatus Gottesmanbacteria bacterium]
MPSKENKKIIADAIFGLGGGVLLLLIFAGIGFSLFEGHYRNRVYPHVTVAHASFAGQTKDEVTRYWLAKNEPFTKALFTFTFANDVATISGTELNVGYDATLSATQAMAVGRSGHIFADWYSKFGPSTINLSPLFHWDEEILDEKLNALATRITIPVQDALFSFANNRVSAFRPSHDGRHVNIPALKEKFRESLTEIADRGNHVVRIPVSIIIDKPTFTTEGVNSFGVKELIGRGYSEFAHSIPGRIHNVTLAAARINGILIKPGDTFSFNDALGDVSALTGFQPAYVIKEGKTVLGDGGGVCQVSSTLFRAILNAGLPVVERREHAYRVGYYEQAGYKPGLDATVYAPSVDLKFKNDTPGYLLIQTKTDPTNLTLTFEFYGTRDGRRAEILNHKIWGEAPPPPDLYQDDPTLPTGTIKQVDFAAWGAKASFQYKVTRNGETLQDRVFTSNFRPWQAVFLRGTAQ